MRSSAVGADRDRDGTGGRAEQFLPLGDRNVNGGVNIDGSGDSKCNGSAIGSGDDNGNGNGSAIGSGNCSGDDCGSGNGTPEDASGGDNRYLSNASRGELLVWMGLVRARLGGGRVAGDGRLRPVAESLWREVEELGRSRAGENQTAGE